MAPTSKLTVCTISIFAALGTAILPSELTLEAYAQSSKTPIAQRRVPPPQGVQPPRPPGRPIPELPPAPRVLCIVGNKVVSIKLCDRRISRPGIIISADPEASLKRGRILTRKGDLEGARKELLLAAAAFKVQKNNARYQEVRTALGELPQRAEPPRVSGGPLPNLPPAPPMLCFDSQLKKYRPCGKDDGTDNMISADPEKNLQRGDILFQQGAIQEARAEWQVAANTFKAQKNDARYQEVMNRINKLK